MFRTHDPYRTDNPFYIVSFAVLTILTLGISALLFYDYFMENPYWYNRWKFRSLLKKGKVKIISEQKFKDVNIQEILIEIENTEYKLWIWGDEDITLSSEDGKKSYIGLFTGTLITKWLKRDAVKRIKLLIG
jgi:hypothetical protein